MFALNQLSSAFGLDIGDRTFKLVQLAARRGGMPRIVAWGSVDVPAGVLERGEIKDMEAASRCLAALVKAAEGRLSGRAAVACLPDEKTFVQFITIGKEADPERIREAVLKEISLNVPLPADDLYFDYEVISAVPEAVPSPAAMPETTPILFGAAPKDLVERYAELLERAGLETLALDVEATAISRAIIPENDPAIGAIGVLDIGATRSSLVVTDGGVLRMSIGIPISGLAITEKIGAAFGISMDDAEKLKRECGLDQNRCEDKMWTILKPLIDEISEKISAALQYYHRSFPAGTKIERVYLCGGGALFREIDTVLSRKLALQVRKGDPTANLDIRLPRRFPEADGLQYATAIGLALRALDEHARYLGRRI